MNIFGLRIEKVVKLDVDINDKDYKLVKDIASKTGLSTSKVVEGIMLGEIIDRTTKEILSQNYKQEK